MYNLMLSVLLMLGLGTVVAGNKEDIQVAKTSVDQPAVQYMMTDPGGH